MRMSIHKWPIGYHRKKSHDPSPSNRCQNPGRRTRRTLRPDRHRAQTQFYRISRGKPEPPGPTAHRNPPKYPILAPVRATWFTGLFKVISPQPRRGARTNSHEANLRRAVQRARQGEGQDGPSQGQDARAPGDDPHAASAPCTPRPSSFVKCR